MKRISTLLAAALILGGCSTASSVSSTPAPAPVSSTSTSASAGGVVIRTFAFGPQSITVKAGSTVTWTNQDAILHTVTAGTPANPGTAFDAKLDGVGSTFSFTFSKPGTYPYHCSIHEVMRGVITVT